jgi:hypothetical protein
VNRQKAEGISGNSAGFLVITSFPREATGAVFEILTQQLTIKKSLQTPS